MAEMQLNVGLRNLQRNTNILTIKVPEHLQRKASTGLSFVDDAFTGDDPSNPNAAKGITPSTSCLFTGMSGAGKTTLMLQMADRITAEGHICLFNTNEESLYQVANTCNRLRLRSGFVAGQDRLIGDVIDHAKELQRQVKGKKTKKGQPVQVFVIVDSLQTMDDGKYADGSTNSNTPLRVVEQLTEWAKQKNHNAFGIAIVIGQVKKDGEFAGKNSVKHAVDAHCHLRIDIDPKSDTYGERLFEVQKHRFGPAGLEYVLTMTRTGLVEKKY